MLKSGGEKIIYLKFVKMKKKVIILHPQDTKKCKPVYNLHFEDEPENKRTMFKA